MCCFHSFGVILGKFGADNNRLHFPFPCSVIYSLRGSIILVLLSDIRHLSSEHITTAFGATIHLRSLSLHIPDYPSSVSALSIRITIYSLYTIDNLFKDKHRRATARVCLPGASSPQALKPSSEKNSARAYKKIILLEAA